MNVVVAGRVSTGPDMGMVDGWVVVVCPAVVPLVVVVVPLCVDVVD